MRLATFAALAAAIIISASNADPDHHEIRPLATTCNNDGRCSTDASGVRKDRHASVTTKSEHRSVATDANGNTVGLVISHKTGARASVNPAHTARFQSYIDDLENNHGARVLFMGGIRPGRCKPESQHPCGKALDICQLSRGRVDPRCNLPGRAMLAQIASAHGLFEGGRWCQSDYGHAQIGATAAACDGPLRIVRQTIHEVATGELHP